MIKEYSENLFERFVDHIIVYSRHLVGFVMKCGLTFKEVI
ncbi:site-specific recombinase phage integrase family [Eubacterium sp. CAG:581]|nr:site-specific recombinase phage integrase family [Eubacterium sp. CAG:581]